MAFLIRTFLIRTFLIRTFLIRTYLVRSFFIRTFVVRTFLGAPLSGSPASRASMKASLLKLPDFFFRSLESLSDESAVLESEPASLGLGPVFDVKFIQNEEVARMAALDDANCVQVFNTFTEELYFQVPNYDY